MKRETVAIGHLIEEQHREKIEAAFRDAQRETALIRQAGELGESTEMLKHQLGALPSVESAAAGAPKGQADVLLDQGSVSL